MIKNSRFLYPGLPYCSVATAVILYNNSQMRAQSERERERSICISGTDRLGHFPLSRRIHTVIRAPAYICVPDCIWSRAGISASASCCSLYMYIYCTDRIARYLAQNRMRQRREKSINKDRSVANHFYSFILLRT